MGKEERIGIGSGVSCDYAVDEGREFRVYGSYAYWRTRNVLFGNMHMGAPLDWKGLRLLHSSSTVITVNRLIVPGSWM